MLGLLMTLPEVTSETAAKNRSDAASSLDRRALLFGNRNA